MSDAQGASSPARMIRYATVARLSFAALARGSSRGLPISTEWGRDEASGMPESITSRTLVCRMNWQLLSRTAGSVSLFDSSSTVSMRAAFPLVTSLLLLIRSNILMSWLRCQAVSRALCELFCRVETQSRMGSGRFWACARHVNKMEDSRADSRRIEGTPGRRNGIPHEDTPDCVGADTVI